jgi:tRNA (cytidine/uridine-2'-O-)-methyltransferase
MKNNFFNIVLYEAEIPQNCGNIARMCVANDLKLHLIEPLGFELSDKHLKRAGLDYWQYLNYETYTNWKDFLKKEIKENKSKIWFLSSKVKKNFWDASFRTGDYLVFGPETRGLPRDLLDEYPDTAITVPMTSSKARSLNLASTVQTVYYEAFRQQTLS